MDCYKDLSPSREALFAIGECKVSALLLSRGSDQAPVQQPAKHNAGQIFLRFLSISYRRFLTPKQ
jgi:hypothetical protein